MPRPGRRTCGTGRSRSPDAVCRMRRTFFPLTGVSIYNPTRFLAWSSLRLRPVCIAVGSVALLIKRRKLAEKRACAPHTARITPAIAENWSANDIASRC